MMARESVILIEHSTEIARPIEEVFAFYETPDNYRRVTASPAGVEILRVPLDLRPGSVFAYRLRGWPVELRWEALVSEYQPPVRFVHVLSDGIFRQWSHEHHFVAQGAATQVRELLKYRMPNGLINALAHRFYVRDKLEELVSTGLENARQLLERNEVGGG